MASSGWNFPELRYGTRRISLDKVGDGVTLAEPIRYQGHDVFLAGYYLTHHDVQTLYNMGVRDIIVEGDAS